MGNSKKYSFLIKCTDGTVNLTTGYGDDYSEAREYFERNLNKEWSLITDSQVIKAFIAKENETRVVIKGTEWFWEALDKLEAQNNESSESSKMDEFEKLFTKVAQVQGDQDLTCSCTECYWNMYFPKRSDSKECVSESLADFKMTPNSTQCKGYWSYEKACGHPKR